jgi:hypothetical protein
MQIRWLRKMVYQPDRQQVARTDAENGPLIKTVVGRPVNIQVTDLDFAFLRHQCDIQEAIVTAKFGSLFRSRRSTERRG